MTVKNSQNLWIPYVIAGAGIVLSGIIWHYLLYHIDTYFNFLKAISNIIPWGTLVIGICISILVGAVIRITQVANYRASTLNDMNISLKKEISVRINAEETKQKLEVALLQGQKLQAMGTLASGIAHDFNNLLYAIIGYVEMARDDVDKNTLVYANLGKVLEASFRGQELISRILAFSRRQHHQFNELDLQTTIEAALSLLRPTIPASVIVHYEAETHPTILGNQTQIHQVLVNIINNAVDAMDGEGTINIHLSSVAADDPILKQFPDIKVQPYCKIEIIDSGHGMDQSIAERIFEPFFTTKEVGKGTGLGLSIVHSIIKEHQGEISVTSQLGHGTRFMMLLPTYSPTQ